MLTETAIKQFQGVLEHGVQRRICANFWNSEGKSPIEKFLYFAAYYVGLLYYTGDVCYLSVTVYQLLVLSDTQPDVLFKVLLHWSSRFVCLLFQFYNVWYRHEIELYVKQIFSSHCNLERMYTWNI